MRIQVAEQDGELRLYRHHGEGEGPFQTVSEGIVVETVNYSGHVFADFHARRDPSTAPGWFVFGRNGEKYGRLRDGDGAYIMLCARPEVAPRRHPHYNGPVQRGWHRKSEAQAVADHLNEASRAKAG